MTIYAGNMASLVGNATARMRTAISHTAAVTTHAHPFEPTATSHENGEAIFVLKGTCAALASAWIVEIEFWSGVRNFQDERCVSSGVMHTESNEEVYFWNIFPQLPERSEAIGGILSHAGPSMPFSAHAAATSRTHPFEPSTIVYEKMTKPFLFERLLAPSYPYGLLKVIFGADRDMSSGARKFNFWMLSRDSPSG